MASSQRDSLERRAAARRRTELRPAATGGEGPLTAVRLLAEAYVSRRDALRALLTRRTRDVAAAEDLLQDLWLRIARLERPPMADPEAYLQTMAVNLARDWLRNQSWRAGFAAPDAEAETVAAPGPDAEGSLASRQALAFLLAVIEELSPRRREALLLYRFEALPIAEVARRMGTSRRTAEAQVAQAIAFCHARLVAAGYLP